MNILRFYIALSFFFPLSIFAQTLSGSLINIIDNSRVSFAKIVFEDMKGDVLLGTTSNMNGKFSASIPSRTYTVKIYRLTDFAELQILNISGKSNEIIVLDCLPLIKAPDYINVSYTGLSKRKEAKNQSDLIKKYNKKIKNYDDLEVEINGKKIMLIVSFIRQTETKRLRLIYTLDLEKLNE